MTEYLFCDINKDNLNPPSILVHAHVKEDLYI